MSDGAARPLTPELRALLLEKLRRERQDRRGPEGIPRRERSGERPELPLSWSQQQLWFLDRYVVRRSAYNVPVAFDLDGPLDPAALRAALDEIVRRHEVLRTTYPADRAVQVVHPPRPLPLPVAEIDGEEALRAAVREAAERPFDLQAGPVLAAVLFRRGASRHVLLLTFHHIATDGWSTGVLVRELETLYAAFAAGRPPDLPELPIQYGDFAAWQRERLTGERREELLSHWRERLEEAAQIELPLDRPRPARQALVGARRRLALPPDLAEALRATAAREQVTVFALLLAAFQALLHRYTGQDDQVVGVPFANRPRPELEPLIGYFVNTLPVRGSLHGGVTGREAMRRTHQALLDAQEHQELPFEALVDALEVPRDTSRPPIYSIVFTYQAAPPETERAGGLRFAHRDPEVDSAKFDLTAAAWERDGRIEGDLVYDVRLFDPETIERFAHHWTNLLRGLVRTPEARLREIDILAPEERRLLGSGRFGRAPLAPPVEPFPEGALIHRLFERQAAERPDAVALVFEGEHWSYRALGRRSGRLARRLRAAGVGPEVKIGLCHERSTELIVGILGILRAGAVYVPLDPSYPEERLGFIARDAGLERILTSEAHLGSLPDSVRRDTGWLEPEPDGADREDGPPPSTVPDNGAYVIYTSGSTGKPKGVPISHRNVLRLFERTRPVFDFGPDDAWTLFHSYAFDFSVWEIWGALFYGGRLVVVPYWVSRSPDDFVALLERQRVTVLNQSPSAFRQLFHERRELAAGDLAVRYVVFGAEALDWRLLDPWFRRFGDAAAMVNMYGITETTVHVTHRRALPGETPYGSPVGRAIDDLEVYVLDPAGDLAPIGVTGEIHVGGPGLARGYLHRPALTAQRFVPNPFASTPGDRLYRSGDTARFVAEGEMVFLGRNDDQVKIRGFRIELGEVRAAVAGLPDVRDAVVLADTNPHGESYLAAWVIPAPDAAPTVRRLREALGSKLPEYMVPARFVFLDELPLTAHGKLDRRALPPAWEAEQRQDDGAAPAVLSATEEVLAAIFGEALGGVEVGREDGFFALGGDSILSLRVLGMARERGLEFSLQDLFQLQTVKLLARHLARDGAAGGGEEAPAYQPFDLVPEAVRRSLPPDVEDAYPLSKLQLGMLYEMRLAPELLPYHNVDSVRLRGHLDREAFLTSARMLAERHPIFRTSLHVTGRGDALQRVHRGATLPAAWVDLRELPPEEREAALDRYLERERREPFDPEVPGLLRLAVHQLEDDLFQFSLTECHAILDGWSLTSSIAELFDRHARIVLDGDREPLPPPRLRFAEAIAREIALTEAEEPREFWRARVAGYRPREIPRWPDEGDGTGELNELSWTIAPERVATLRRLARSARVPLKSVLLAAHAKVMSLLLGTADVLLGMQSNGRPETEGADEVRGLYLNAMPLRVPLRPGTWTELVQQLFQAEWEALPYRAFPLAAIQEMAGGARLFEAFFNFVRFHSMEEVIRARHLEVVGDALFYEPNHFPLLAGFNLDPVSDEMTAVLQSARREIPPAQLAAIREYYEQALAALESALDPEGAEARHELWNPAGELHADPSGLDYEHLGLAGELAAAPAAPAEAEPAAAHAGSDDVEAPATTTEEILAAVWSEVLAVDRIGREDGFFVLGGDSLLSLRALAAAKERGVPFTLQQLYEHATLRELAREIDLGSAPEVRTARTEPFSLVPDEVRRRLPADVVDAYPMASLQLGMLYHMELDPELLPYHNVDSGLFRARLEEEPFRRAVQRVIDRHPILRTGFELREFGEPLQLVHRTATMPIVWEDLRGLAPEEREERLERYLESERASLFDIRRPPLLRYAVHRLSDDEIRFSMTENHILLDGWSFNAILAEVFEGYWRLADGEEPEPQPPPDPPYREFIRLEREAIASETSRSFWRRRVEGSPRLLIAEPPEGTDGADGAAPVFKSVEVTVSGERAAALERRAREWMVPLKTVFLAAHLRVLALLAGVGRVVTGLVTNGRPESGDGSEVYGLFLNTVPFPVDVPADEPWADLVARVFAHEREVLPHRRVPMGEIQADHGGETLFEVMFNYISFHSLRGLLERDDFDFMGEIRSASPTHYPLAVSFNRNPVDGEVAVILQAGTRRLSRERTEAVAALYAATLEALGGDRPVSAPVPEGVLEVVTRPERPAGPEEGPGREPTPEELQRVVFDWNDTAVAFPEASPIHRVIAARIAEAPDAVALEIEGRALSYGALGERAGRLARRLREAGVGPSVPVGIAAERSLELVVGLLAILEAGGAYVPFDPSYPERRLAGMLRELLDAHPGAVLLTQPGLPEIAAEADGGEPAPEPRRIVLERGEGPRDGLATAGEPAGEELAYVIFTSGSTGRPKGVMNSHRAILNRLLWAQSRYRLTEADRVLQKTPMSFDVSVWELFWPLMAGARMVLARPGGHQDTAYLAGLVERRGVTLMHFVPSILELFLREPDLAGCASLRAVLASGEALAPDLVDRFEERLGGLGVELHNLYGPTEAAVDVSSWRVLPRNGAGGVPIGRPVANTRLYVLDPDLRPVPPGASGQLALGGVQLARGYLGRPARTAGVFVPDPLAGEPGGRIYLTGDLARHRPDGAVEYLGRIDHQVKLRGVRIELGEIEAVLRGLDGVRDAAVVLQDSGRLGPHLVACLVAAGEEPPGAAELRSRLQERLPDSMVPALFVYFDAFPLTPSGKTDRGALARAADRRTAAIVPPRTPLEEILAAIWAEVLELPEVGIERGFVELGGHSLLAMRAISRIRDAVRLDLPLRALFEQPTLAALAAHVEAERARGAAPPPPPVARRPDPGAPAPLSFSQERLWVLDRFLPDSPQYNIPKPVRLLGELDAAALAGALRALEARHEALRTTFAEIGGEPSQVVAPPDGHGLPVVDLTALPPDRRSAEASALATRDARRPFDLGRGPLHRATLVRESAGSGASHVLVLTFHHAIADAWSLDVLFRELAGLYTAAVAGRPATLEPLPVQFADYAVWQRERLTGEVLEGLLGWWREHLAGAPPALELPTDRPLPRVRTWPGATLRGLAFRDGLTRSLTELSRRHGATLFTTLLAAFQALLRRYSGQSDLVVGLPVANRPRPELEGVVGFFVNTMAVRTDLSGRPSVGEALERTRDALLAAHQHQELPFEKLVAELQPERDLSRTPLFQVMFVFHHEAVEPEMPGLGFEALPVDGGAAKFDLLLSLSRPPAGAPGGEGLRGEIEYDRELFDATTVRRFAEHLERLLELWAAHPGAAIGDLPLLSPRETAQLLHEWNPPAREATGRPLHRRFAEQAERTPDRVAAAFGDGCLSYRGLANRARRLARALTGAGARPGAGVGLFLDRSLDTPVALLAVLEAGGVCVPLDPAYPVERLRFMIEDTALPVVVTVGRLAGRLAELAGGGTRVVLADAAEAPEPGEPEAPDAPAVPLDQPLYVVYTSGSTGRPKGVELPHRALDNLTDVFLEQCRPAARTLQFAPLSFDVCYMEHFTAWASGGSVHGVPAEVRADVPALARFVAERRIELAVFPVALLHLLCEEIVARASLGLDTGRGPGLALRDAISTGEQMVITEAVRRAFSLPGLAGCRLHNHYGPSETHVVTTATLPPDPAAWADRPDIGRPIANVRAYVAGADGRLQPVGVPGELLLGGDHALAQGYLARPALTAGRFRPDPWAATPGGRLYRTGDLARQRPDGTLEYLGRIDRQVKLRGFRIEPGEIESVLRAHPAVDEAVVMLRTDRGEARLVAYAVPEGEAPAADALLRFVAERVPEYMVPSACVLLDRMPVDPNGKIDRRALPAPEPPARPGGDAPRNAHEEIVAGIWASLLGLPRVGIHDDFFALGGHSLLATRLVSRLRDVLDVEVPLRAVFEAPTVAQLAARTREALTAGRRPLPPVEPRGEALRTGVPLPLSFSQRRLWFLDRLQPDSPAYNIPIALLARGDLDPAALAASLDEIVRRHEALRTTFALRGGEPVQVVHAARRSGPPTLPVADLSALPPARREVEARRLAGRESLRPFSLERGPLLRTAVVRLDRDRHVLLLTLHHVVGDGWSLGVLVRELGATYRALSSGREPELAPLAVQYPDFALWQERWLGEEALEEELGYWREALAGLSPAELPTDRPRPVRPTHRGAGRIFELPAELHGRIEALARSAGATPFMVLLAAFQALLARTTGRSDVAVGTAVAGRNLLHTEDLIGVFVNTLVLRTEVPEGDARDLIGAVRETTLGAYAHQSLPFETLVDALDPEREVGRTPLVDVMFGLQNQPLEPLVLEGLEIEPFYWRAAAARFDMSWSFEAAGGGLRGGVVYRTELFDATTVERMIGHFRRLLEALLRAPERPVGELDPLSAAERHQLVLDWNDTGRAFGGGHDLARLVREQAARTPDAVAVRDDRLALSYGELDRRAVRLARRLARLGVGPETRVAVHLERSVETPVALLAVLEAGGAFVPLDPEQPPARTGWMLDDCGAAVLIARGDLPGRRPEAGPPRVDPTDGAPDGADGGAAGAPAPESPAYVLYTSGSTGRPKGVEVSHRAIVNHMRWQQDDYPLGPGDTVLHKTPPSFDPSVAEIFAPLWVGATLALTPPGGHRDPTDLVARAARHRATHLQAVPTLLEALAGEPGLEACDALGRIYSGGEVLTRSLARRLAGPGGPRAGAVLINVYGPTEAAIRATSWRWRDDGAAGPGEPAEAGVPIGRPIANATAFVLDARMRPVPAGVSGELSVGGAGLARGYLGRPALTAERFVPHPLGEPGERLYRTGDRARRLADGRIEYLGRLDHQVKLRGHRVEPGEVEAVLEEQPGVSRAVVVAADGALAAFVTARPEGSPGDLRDALRGRLPAFMVPRTIEVVPELPLLPSGKVDRGELRRRAAAGRPLEAAEHRPPRDRFEIETAKVWEELLGVERVGLDDDFFALGGHSLLAVALTARIEERLGATLPLTAPFQASRLEEMASAVREAGEATGPSGPLVPLQREGDGPPWFFVHPVGGQVHWYLELARRLGPEIPSFGLQAPGLTDDGRLLDDVPAIAAAYTEAIREERPEGPYLLAGWSAGGTLAFEIAHRLRSAGEEVASLVLIDAPRGLGARRDADAEGDLDPEVRLWIDLLVDLAAGGGPDPREWAAALTPLDARERRAFVAADLRRRRLLPPGLGDEQVERMLGVYFATRRAVRSYEPAVYPGSGVLVRSAGTVEALGGPAADPAFGWEPYLAGGLERHDLPGDHYSILSRDGVGPLASLVKRLRHRETEVSI